MINRNKTKQIILRVIKILFIIISLIFLLLFTITRLFSDEIENEILKKIKSQINTSLTLEDVEFTFYDNFPKASVRITNLLIKEPEGFENDTLIFSKKAYIEISLLDIFDKNYNLENIIISDAKINIKYNNLNEPNYDIFKKAESSEKQNTLDIKKISLLNTNLEITKATTELNINWDLHKALILINDTKFNIEANGFSKNLTLDSNEYMLNKKIDFSTNTLISKNSTDILNLTFQIEETSLQLSGSIINDSISLNVSSSNENVKKFISIMPENVKKLFTPFDLNGEVSFTSQVKGTITKNNNPYFEMQYRLENGYFKKYSHPFTLNQIYTEGSVNNGAEKNFKTTTIVANNFKGKTKNGFLNGDFTVSNLNNYFLSASFKSAWDINELNNYFSETNFVSAKGKLYTESNYVGNIAFDNRLKKMFLNANHISKIKLDKVEFFYKDFPLKFAFKSLDGEIKNKMCFVNSSSSTISESDIKFNGEIENLIGYILDEYPKIFVRGSATSTYTNFEELMTLSDLNSQPISTNNSNINDKIMPEWISCNTYISINNFSYDNIIASNVTGDLTYNKGIISLKDINGSLLGGSISGKFILNETKPNHLNLNTNIDVDKINIRNSFNAFNNFNQEFIAPENIKGIGSAKLYVNASWKPGYILNTKDLKINSHLIIEKGELIDFKPLESLSGYVSLDELKHVKFSKLENNIKVDNEIITIPTMEIKSSALSVYISGTHSFSNEINYNVTLLLSELLSKKFREKNTTIQEFGEEKKDGKILNTIYFKMSGDTDNPKVTLDKIRFLEDFKKTVEKEKTIIENIYNVEILKENENMESDDEDDEIEIEWEPQFK